jgi:hypothetical protein
MRPAKPAPTMWTELALAPAVEAGAEAPEPDSEAAALDPVPEAEEPRLQCQNDLLGIEGCMWTHQQSRWAWQRCWHRWHQRKHRQPGQQSGW